MSDRFETVSPLSLRTRDAAVRAIELIAAHRGEYAEVERLVVERMRSMRSSATS